MTKYMAIYDVLAQPFEEAPEKEKRNYEIIAENDFDARKQAETERTNILRNELLPGSEVKLERLVEIKDIKI